ncbi:hypothetical protein [Sphingobium lactosutens]|uniref:hypothetical protein n=1 Tax=Sphingobium lactosutens TaxID=522773 RepID=UPI0015BD36DB|nr:hypothetical protein [Sphingobium lactosutens]
MKNWGMGLIALGAIIAAVALFVLPSTISQEEMTTLPYTGSVIGSGRFTETYNLPRAQIRELALHAGSVLFLGGILLFVGGTLEERIRATGSASVTVDTEASDGIGQVESVQAIPPYIHPDPEEAARNKTIAAWVIVISVVALAVVGFIGASRDRGAAEASAGSTESAAERASQAADDAMNAALNAADNAARAAR